jgi:SMI1 / KNR4 family (SUKH-1)
VSSIGERLRAHWSAHGVNPPPGVSEERLRGFEDRFGVALPADLRGYLIQVDGTGSRSESDSDWFSFWPLGDIVRASDEYQDQFIEDQSSYFIFADHSICLPAYAIQLSRSDTDPNRVIAIWADLRQYSTANVAWSFSEFLDRYLADESSRLYLGAGVPTEV